MNCPICKDEMVTIHPTLWGCLPCDSLWFPERLNDYILWKNAAAAEAIEVCRILVAQWETRYRMENAALWEQELYAQARAALEPQP